MRSALYTGLVHHRRFGATSHALRYRMTMALLDLDELDELDSRLRLFSRNRWSLFAFHDRDHLPADRPAGTSLRAMVEGHLSAAGIAPDGGAIALLSLPRILGYAFNPLSVYFCHRRDGTLAAILYEVRNTFRQRHTYVIPVDPYGGGRSGPAELRQGLLRLALPRHGHALRLPHRSSGRTHRRGSGRPARGGADHHRLVRRRPPRTHRRDALLRSFLAHPLLSFAVVGGIHWEALKLWLKGAGLRARPLPPQEAATIVARREV